MARMTGATCRLCRREGEKLFLKGTKCSSDKCAVAKRETAPGQHGKARKKKLSDYAIQLREKQKAKRIYGILERQFKWYFKRAEKAKGSTGETLLQILERRLDNVIHRACFAESRARARQLVGHNFVKVNGKRVDIPSYNVSVDDVIVMKGTEAQLAAIKDTFKVMADRGRMVPDWIEVSADALTVKIKRLPVKKDLGLAIEENLIVELYSK